MSDFFTDLLAEVEAEMNYQDTNNLIDARERVQNRLQWRSFQQQHSADLAQADQNYLDIYDNLSPSGQAIANDIERLVAIARQQGLLSGS